MAKIIPETIIAHWNTMVQGVKHSSKSFYDSVEHILGAHNLEHLKVERVNLSQGGLFSANREYLQIRRDALVFHICAAPFGNGFFVSWWLGEREKGLFAFLARIPVIGFFVRNVFQPLTYYKADTRAMFQSVTHGAVLATLDAVVSAQGVRALSDVDRKPVMRDFFGKV